jgi:hypothetical protein
MVLAAGNQEVRTAFMNAYHEHASAELRSEIARVLPLFEVLFALRLAVKGKNVNFDDMLVLI